VTTDPDPGTLLEVLEESRRLGLLGPGPVAGQLSHAVELAEIVGHVSGPLLDLGSGGGLPGLALFHRWPHAAGVLLDAQRRRCDFLLRAVTTLGMSDRVEVRCGRAEVLARDAALRNRFELVVARSFGPPPVTAECAVGFLRPGGRLVVTEPPDSVVKTRWDPAGLAELGFGEPVPIREGETGAVRIDLEHEVDERWPRRNGVPSKRPLW
jgi:16S rRNA (guanine527-N7)-methyltransferase